MSVLGPYSKEIVAAFLTLVVWGIQRILTAQAKIWYGIPHEFCYLVDESVTEPDGTLAIRKANVYAKTYHIANVGRSPATKVEVTFNQKPPHLNIWPVRKSNPTTEPDGRHILTFESVAPKDRIVIELISYNQPVPDVILLRCHECIPVKIPMLILRDFGKWRYFFAFLALTGMATLIYVFFLIVQLAVFH